MSQDESIRSVHLLEFEKLRDEIDQRFTAANNLIVADLAVLGTGVAALEKFPDVLLGFAFISCFLWLAWMDIQAGTYRIAAYIAIVLSDALGMSDKPVLGWERFWRLLRTEPSARAVPSWSPGVLNKIARVHDAHAHEIGSGFHYVLLFAVVPPIMVATYVSLLTFALFPNTTQLLYLRSILVFAAVVLYIYTVGRFRAYRRFTGSVTAAVQDQK